MHFLTEQESNNITDKELQIYRDYLINNRLILDVNDNATFSIC
jgi:hypothetical protein